MQLFDIIKLIFNNKQKEWKSVGKIDKSRNFFMINRIMAIQFPNIANQFNKIKINPDATVDWWRNNLSSRYSRPPSWIYTKTIKKEAKTKKSTDSSWENVEVFVRDRYNVSKRDLSDLKRFYPMKYDLWMKDISDQIGIKNNS
jgi:hypothetical protein